MEALKTLWRSFVAFHNSRLMMSLPRATKESHQGNFDFYFARAKRLSDFVGLIIRWSFAQFAAYYFWHVSKQAEFWLTSYVLGYCGLISFAVATYLGVLANILVLLYWSREIHTYSSRWARIGVTAFSITITGMLWFGTWRLVRDLAQASSLLGT